MRTAQSRTPIPLTISQVKLAATDRYRLRDQIAEFAFRRDLFDYKLPIDNDIYFFGRETLVSELLDQIKKCQNTGIFGLRKTGKTSLLYKVSRTSEINEIAKCIYIDCKSPTIRKKTAEELLSYLTRIVASSSNTPMSRFEKRNPYEAFEDAVWLSSKKRPICLIFDEIEYISPFSLTDPHWSADFIDFWQLLWSIQSQVRHLSFIVCGVNAAVCETDNFNRIQNPLFGIFANKYIHGLDYLSLRRMVQYFGGQMGMHFSDAAIRVLERHYGGHPLLTRMACSHIHKTFEIAEKRRPIEISNTLISGMLMECDQEIAPYCAHIVSELRDFYPDEYDVIEMSAVGFKHEFAEYGSDLDMSRHLRAYGIMKLDAHGLPEVTLPVLSNYLKTEYSRRKGEKISRILIPPARRESWVHEIVSRIIHDLRSLLRSLPDNLRSPFGGKSIPDSDILSQIKPSSTRENFENFITAAYKVLYENIKRGYPNRDAYFKDFKTDWPALFRATDRIRIYRDHILHIDVSDSTKSAYSGYLNVDMDGRDPDEVKDGWFALQQSILDELIYSIQSEAAAKGS